MNTTRQLVTMKLLYILAVIYLVLQVAVGQSCPSGVDIKLPEDTDLLAEFYDNGRTTQVVPPQGIKPITADLT